MKLLKVLGEITNQTKCIDCPLKGRKPLVIEPFPKGEIKVLVVTESPWEPNGNIEFLTSVANVPTYPYLYCLLSGKFKPREDANAYWTHTCKCYLKGTNPTERKRAIKICSEAYLKSEVEAVQPKLVVTVGKSALSYFAKETGDKRLKGRLTKVFLNQSTGIYEDIKLGSVIFSLAVVPHPSGKNRFWNKPTKGAIKTFKRIVKDIKEKIT